MSPPHRSVTAAPGTPLRTYWETESCGTHYVDAEKYTREYFDSIEGHRYRVEPFIPEFAEFARWRGKRGLEVGVGTGTDFLQFLRAGADMSGVDLTDAAVDHVKRRGELYGFRDVDVRQANAEQLPFADATFDFVYSWGVIHHADDTWTVFDEIFRVTKPGGTIKIMVYNVNATIVWLKWLHHAALARKWTMGPREGRRWALANFQESGGTKGYTAAQIRDALSRYPHSGLTFRFYDDRVQEGDKYAGFFRVLRAIEPASMRWFLTFELTKR